MAIRRFVIQTVSAYGSAINPAENVWRIEAGGQSDPAIAAALLNYTYTAMNYFAGYFSVTAVLAGPDAGPLLALAYPLAEYEALHGLFPFGVDFVIDSYGVQTGNANEMCPPGASVLVTEYTSLGGRHNGRKYLPWLSTIGTDTNGLLEGTVQGSLPKVYLERILGTDSSTGDPIAGFTPLSPVVGTGASPVGSSRVSPTPARLKTRIR